MRTLGTILLVSFVTVLIWVFAEGESIKQKELRLDLVLGAEPGADRVLAVVEGQGWRDRVDVVVEGATASIERAEAAAKKSLRLAPGDPGVPTEPGEHLLDIRTILRENAIFREAGITILRTEPAAVRIETDFLISRPAQITVELEDGELDGPAELKPSGVEVKVPSRFAPMLPEEPRVLVRLDRTQLAGVVPGRRQVFPDIRARPAAGLAGIPGLRIEPPHVELAVRLKSRTATITLPSVPVLIRIAPGEINNWEVTIADADRFISNVRVSGPSDLIAQVSRGELRIVAVVPLSFEDLERGIAAKEAVFSELPTPFTFEADSKMINLRIRRIGTPAGEAGRELE